MSGVNTFKSLTVMISSPSGRLYREILEQITSKLDTYYTNPSIPQRIQFIYDKKIHFCKCGDVLGYTKPSKGGYKKTCNKKDCIEKNRQNSIRNTSLDKYGETHYMKTEFGKKIQETVMMNKYGVKHNWSSSELRKAGQEKTMIEKYGVSHALQNLNIQEKKKQTLIQKFGTNNMFQIFMYKNLLERFGYSNPMHIKEFKDKSIERIKTVKRFIALNSIYESGLNIELIDYKNNYFEYRCLTCKNEFFSPGSSFNSYLRNKINPCQICNPPDRSYVSNAENELADYVTSLGVTIYSRNSKILLDKRKEIDIFIKSHNIGIEFNGLYWHSEAEIYFDHDRQKSFNAREKGIRLIHIWEDDWTHKKEICKNRIKSIFQPKKIHARKCEFRIINNHITKTFLNQYHISGSIPAKYHFGLFLNDELISVMTFGSSLRAGSGKNKKNPIKKLELLRYCIKENCQIIGGIEKIFKNALKFLPNDLNILCYSDFSWNNFNSNYEKLGFKFIKITYPNYWYIVNGIRIHRYQFAKHILNKQGFDPKKTEKEIMQERKILRIFDCGSQVWEMKRTI